MFDSLSTQPLILNHNRVKRAYIGGKLLDQWQGIEPATDNHYPEEFLISTVEVTNEDRFPGEGLSTVTLADGRVIPLRDIIASNPPAFLGKQFGAAETPGLGVLARVGDTIVRHVIQAHPDREFARKYLNFPSGKTEAWYILACREVGSESPHAYVGFKKGVTRADWEALFAAQDEQGMLDALHRVSIAEGDVLLIEAGMPHAIGPGAMFLEVHEPNDYTFRLQRKFVDRVFTDQEIHYGLGLQRLFDAFHYDTYTLDEIVEKVLIKPVLKETTGKSERYALVTYQHTPYFAMDKFIVRDRCAVEANDDHRIAIVIRGSGVFRYAGGEQAVRQGQGVFLPSGVKDLVLVSDTDMEVVIAYPPQQAQ